MASRTTLVLSLSSFIMLFSAMINANIFGIIAVLISDISKRSVKFQEKYDTANTAMVNMEIDPKTRKKVREFLLNTQTTQDQQAELDNFLKDISPSLRFKVLVHIFSTAMKSSIIFLNLFDEYGEETVVPFIVRNLSIVLTIPETEIVKQGEIADTPEQEARMYFIAKGDWDVLVRFQENTLPKKVRLLKIGDHFGEISMIYRWRRTATVRSSKYATIGYITRNVFRQVVFKFQKVIDSLCENIYDYDDDLKLFKEETSRFIPYFKNISEESLHSLIFSYDSTNHEKGFVIFSEESMVNKIVIVQNGLVDVETTIDNDVFVLQSLPRGSILNYRKFIQSAKFRITARWKTYTTLLSLTSDRFQKLKEYYDDINVEFMKFLDLNYSIPSSWTWKEILRIFRKSMFYNLKIAIFLFTYPFIYYLIILTIIK